LALDGDSDLDAFVPNTGHRDKVWLNDGSGFFTDSGQSPSLGVSGGRVSLGDVDDDGDLDALIATGSRVWLNDGSGFFTDSGQSLGSGFSDLALGDVDGDGDLDAFKANGSHQNNEMWINVGNGIGDITLNQAVAGSYTLTYDGSSTFSLSRDGGTAVDYVLTTDPASTGSSETATFNIDGNDINIELKQDYDQLDGNDFTFNVQNTTTHQLTGLSGIDQSHELDASVLSVHTVNNVGLVTSTGTWTTDVGSGNGLFNNVSGNSGVTNISNVGGGYYHSSYDTNVLSVDDARTAITAIDHAIDEVNQERSYIGSEQNKLQFTMSNLSNQTQSIEAARSSIQDTDFAADAADLAKNQILAQSATAMLAQASAISQNILSLIAA